MPAILEKSLSIGEFIDKITKLRRSHKNQWITLECTIDGFQVGIKFHNTFIQKLVIDGIDHTPAMEETVKAFNRAIVDAIQYAQYQRAEGVSHDNQG